MQRKRQQQHEMHTMLNNKNCFGWIVGVGTQDEKMTTKKKRKFQLPVLLNYFNVLVILL